MSLALAAGEIKGLHSKDICKCKSLIVYFLNNIDNGCTFNSFLTEYNSWVLDKVDHSKVVDIGAEKVTQGTTLLLRANFVNLHLIPVLCVAIFGTLGLPLISYFQLKI